MQLDQIRKMTFQMFLLAAIVYAEKAQIALKYEKNVWVIDQSHFIWRNYISVLCVKKIRL